MADYFELKKKQVDKMLLRLLRTSQLYKHYPKLDKSLRHTVLLDGKRLRPIMALMTYELFRPDSDKVLPMACGLELIHAGSLMLDDLPSMDNAAVRRGKKTNHVLYGDAVTILASAGLWVEAFRLAAQEPLHTQALIEATSTYVGKDGLILGQYMDLYAFNKKQSLSTLRNCYERKTGSLFALAVSYGAILGDAPAAHLRTLQSFALHFGVAYQIRDDIIDATQSSDRSGKDADKDAANGKPNYVSLLGVDGAKRALQKELAAATKKLSALPYDFIHFTNLLAKLSITD